MLWINARVFKYGVPLISLALFGLNASVIRWGDSLRAYGAGMALAILIGIMIWRIAERPAPRRLVLAALSAVAAVQILYFDAPVVLAFCTAGIVVAILRKNYQSAFGIFAVGAIAALSLTVYVPVIRAAATWNTLVTVPNYDLPWFRFKLAEAISPLGGAATSAWVFVVLVAIWLCVRQLVLKPPASELNQAKVAFAVTALIVIGLSHFAFLKTLSYVTQPWYYLTLLAVTAVTVDIISGTLVVTPRMRVVRLIIAVAAAAASIVPATRYATERITNVDEVARSITTTARPDDMILIAPWYDGVSFTRYYKGSGHIVTVPDMSFHTFHRYDLISAEMQKRDQMEVVRKILEQIRSTLVGGRTVFVVSEGRVWTQNVPQILLPQALIPLDGWKSPMYQKQWSALVGAGVREHAISISTRDLSREGRVSHFENLSLAILRGWRD
jgi:hypothetical protein